MEKTKQRVVAPKGTAGAVIHEPEDPRQASEPAKSEAEELDWEQIDWAALEQQVNRLQARIVKAEQEGRYNKVKALQYLLTRSRAAKLLAVRRVTQNQGSRTPGIDGHT